MFFTAGGGSEGAGKRLHQTAGLCEHAIGEDQVYQAGHAGGYTHVAGRSGVQVALVQAGHHEAAQTAAARIAHSDTTGLALTMAIGATDLHTLEKCVM